LPPGATRCGAVMLAWVALAWGLPIQAADTPDETARAGHQETLEDLPAGAAAERSAAVSTRAVVAVRRARLRGRARSFRHIKGASCRHTPVMVIDHAGPTDKQRDWVR
jgi:hypothetical protein